MGDKSAHPPLLSTRSALSSHMPLGAGTPSQLTPNTRSEAEAALSANSTQQTDSAAPTIPLPTSGSAAVHLPSTDDALDALDAARAAYRCPPNPTRTSTSNYATALAAAATTSPTSTASPVSPLSVSTSATSTATATVLTASPLPVDAAHGVMPLTGIGAGQAEAVRRAQPTGLSLGRLGRQQSWSEQDMKHVYSQRLMVVDGGTAEDTGYSSAGPGEGER